MGRAGRGKGGHDRDHWRLPTGGPGVSDRPSDEPQPDDQGRQLQSPRTCATSDRAGHRTDQNSDEDRAYDQRRQAYEAFDKSEPGWVKTELLPLAAE